MIRVRPERIESMRTTMRRILSTAAIIINICSTAFSLASTYSTFFRKRLRASTFFYDPKYSFLSLGTYSVLREIDLMLELQRRYSQMRYISLGYYVHRQQAARKCNTRQSFGRRNCFVRRPIGGTRWSTALSASSIARATISGSHRCRRRRRRARLRQLGADE